MNKVNYEHKTNMQIYWKNITNPDNINRGLYIILPLRYQGSFQSVAIDKKDTEFPKLTFDSSDFTELLSVKCRNENFVKRFSINSRLKETVEAWNEKVAASKEYQLDDLQFFIFNNGIAFITIYLSYQNKDVDKMYQFINPGYVQDKSEDINRIQDALLNALEEKVFGFIQEKLRVTLSWFTQDEKSKRYIIAPESI